MRKYCICCTVSPSLLCPSVQASAIVRAISLGGLLEILVVAVMPPPSPDGRASHRVPTLVSSSSLPALPPAHCAGSNRQPPGCGDGRRCALPAGVGSEVLQCVDHKNAGCSRWLSAHGHGRKALGPGHETGLGSSGEPAVISSLVCQWALFLPKKLWVNPLPPLMLFAVDARLQPAQHLASALFMEKCHWHSPWPQAIKSYHLFALPLQLLLLACIQRSKPERYLQGRTVATLLGLFAPFRLAQAFSSLIGQPCSLSH